MASSSIDWNQACALLGEQGEVVPDEMRDLFHEMAAYALVSFDQILATPLTEENLAALPRKSHQLRGSILNFGLIEAANILLKIEVEKETISAEEAHDILVRARASCVESLELLKQTYPSLVQATA